MRQFEAYQNPSPESRKTAPFLVVMSSHHLRDLTEVVVAPVVGDAPCRIADLELSVCLNDQQLTLVVSDIFSMRAQQLRRRVGSLVTQEDDIRRALDRLFTGF